MFTSLTLFFRINDLPDTEYIQVNPDFTLPDLAATIHFKYSEHFKDVGPAVLDLWWVPVNCSSQESSHILMTEFKCSLNELFPAGATQGYLHVAIPAWVQEWCRTP